MIVSNLPVLCFMVAERIKYNKNLIYNWFIINENNDKIQ
jgi:hypothetical protein